MTGRQMQEDGELAHGTHGRIFDRRELRGRRAEKLTGAEGGGGRFCASEHLPI
jgi:hypothetical protein